MAAEVGLIVLDCIGLYCTECRDQIISADESPLTDKIFEIYLTFLQVGQSESILGHVFAALRAFVNNFPPILFHGDYILFKKLSFFIMTLIQEVQEFAGSCVQNCCAAVTQNCPRFGKRRAPSFT